MGRMLQPQQVALVVEDDPDVRELAATVFEVTDLKIVEASSAEEALHYLRDHAEEVALVFADVRLPCLMSGVDLIKSDGMPKPFTQPQHRVPGLEAALNWLGGAKVIEE
jgi:DNA-binding NtrC family response regulator